MYVLRTVVCPSPLQIYGNQIQNLRRVKIQVFHWVSLGAFTNSSYICDKYGCNYPMFTEYWSDFMPLPLPLSPKSQQDILSLPLMPTKYRRACSNERTLSTLQTQEKKIFTLQSGISFDSFSWHPHCAPEMDRISIHVEGKVES